MEKQFSITVIILTCLIKNACPPSLSCHMKDMLKYVTFPTSPDGRAYFNVQLMTMCAVVKWNCAVVKWELCSCSCKFRTGTMEKCGKVYKKLLKNVKF